MLNDEKNGSIFWGTHGSPGPLLRPLIPFVLSPILHLWMMNDEKWLSV